MRGDTNKLKLQKKQIAGKKIYDAAMAKWDALNDTQKNQLLNYLNSWDIASHTTTENALYGGLMLVIISIGTALTGGDNAG